MIARSFTAKPRAHRAWAVGRKCERQAAACGLGALLVLSALSACGDRAKPNASATDASTEDGVAVRDTGGDEVAPVVPLDASVPPFDAAPLCDRLGSSAAICERFDEPSWWGVLQMTGSGCGTIAELQQDSFKYVSPYHSYRASFPALDAATQAQCFLSTRVPVAQNYEITFSIFLDKPVGNWTDVMAVFYADKRLSVVLDEQNRPGVIVQNGTRAFATGPLPVQTWMTMGLRFSNDGIMMKAALTIDGVTAAAMEYPATPVTDPFTGLGLIEAYGDEAPHVIYFDDFAVVAK